jgi:hypothetical protein
LEGNGMVLKRRAVSDETAEQAQEALIGIKITKTPLWITIQSMSFRQKALSGNHAGADKGKQNVFKKNCRASRRRANKDCA